MNSHDCDHISKFDTVRILKSGCWDGRNEKFLKGSLKKT